ncbi:hypothetical protein [Xanthomonas arboricola]|uniref:hypothetical protein n=1 Tax=Xanthomonas arboricola TaxID=56448 RepID=UPI0032E8AF06
MKNNPAHVAAIEAAGKALEMPAAEGREYLEMLGCAAVNFMRAQFGDDYVRGWLEHALSDVDHPAMIELRKSHEQH